MFKRFQASFQDVSSLTVAAYLVAIVVYGLWAMMQHLHWSIPFILVGGSVVAQKNLLVVFNLLAATAMAVYGLSAAYNLHWFKCTLALIAPLVVLTLVASLVRKKST